MILLFHLGAMETELKFFKWDDMFWKKIILEAVSISTNDPSEDHSWLYKICHRLNTQHIAKEKRPKFALSEWVEPEQEQEQEPEQEVIMEQDE